jgi:peptidyl-prolyl cis-trans isomerase B (cyclophilin B)
MIIMANTVLFAQKTAKPKIQHAQKILSKPLPKPSAAPGERLVEITTDFGIMVAKLYNETPQHRDNFIKLVKEGFYDSLLFHRVIKSFMIQGGDPLSKRADSTTMLGSGDVGYRIPAEFVKQYFHKRGALSAARDNNPERASSGCQFYVVQGKTYTLEELERIINSRNLSRKQAMLYELAKNDTIQKKIIQLQEAVQKDPSQKEAFQNYVKTLQVIVDKQYNKNEPDKIDYDQVDSYLRLGGAPHLDGDYTVFGELISGFEVLDKIGNSQTRPGDRPLTDIRMKMRMLN